jgi:hypothetical protein
MGIFEEITNKGNRGYHVDSNVFRIVCLDGFTLGVIAGQGTYCFPRPAFCEQFYEIDFLGVVKSEHVASQGFTIDDFDDTYNEVECEFVGPFTSVEIGFPSARPEPWAIWKQYAEEPDNPTKTVYARVPIGIASSLIKAHGGEVILEFD